MIRIKCFWAALVVGLVLPIRLHAQIADIAQEFRHIGRTNIEGLRIVLADLVRSDDSVRRFYDELDELARDMTIIIEDRVEVDGQEQDFAANPQAKTLRLSRSRWAAASLPRKRAIHYAASLVLDEIPDRDGGVVRAQMPVFEQLPYEGIGSDAACAPVREARAALAALEAEIAALAEQQAVPDGQQGRNWQMRQQTLINAFASKRRLQAQLGRFAGTCP